MAKRQIQAGVTDQTVDVFIQDSSSTTGAGLTGLVYNTGSLTCYYRKGATGTPTALSLATQTVGGAHSDGGFVAVDGTNCPGQYRLDLSDTIVATAGMVTVHLKGAANMVPCVLEIEVVDFSHTGQSAIDLKDFADAGYDPTNNMVYADILRINSDADVKDYLVDLLSNGWDNTNNWIRSNEVAISGDSTAADNLEAMVDGTGGVPLKVTSFTITDGLIISATTGNRPAISAIGDGSAPGFLIKSGSSSADAALICQAQGTNDSAIRLIATGTRHGIYATGGDTGHGVYLAGGATSGDGARFEATASGHGINAIGIGSGKYDINAGSLGALYAVLTVSGATTFTGAVVGSNASNNLRINGVAPGSAGGVAIVGSAMSTGYTIKRIAPGGGGDYTSLSAAITALSSTTGVIELVCSAGNIGGGNLHSLTSASEVILRSDLQARHRHDTAQPLSETAYFASNLVFNPTTSGPAKLRIEGLRSSGVSTGFTVTMVAPSKTYDLELVDNLFANSGGVGSGLDQIYCYVEDGTLNVLAVGNTHFFTTTGSAKGYQVYAAATADGSDAARINVRAYGNTGNTDNSAKVTDGIAFASETPGGGTAVIFADVRNNLMLGVAESGTAGAINIQDSGGTTTLTGSHNATNDSSASANGLTSGLTSVVAADVLSSPTTSNVQLSTATTRDGGYALPQEVLGRRVKSGSVWDIGSHEFQAGLSATQLGYVNTSLSTLATSSALSSLTITVGAAGAGLTSVVLAATGLDAISTTAPSGVASNFREMMVQTWRRFFKRTTKSSTQIKTYADNGTSVLTTQTYTSVDPDDDVGAAS